MGYPGGGRGRHRTSANRILRPNHHGPRLPVTLRASATPCLAVTRYHSTGCVHGHGLDRNGATQEITWWDTPRPSPPRRPRGRHRLRCPTRPAYRYSDPSRPEHHLHAVPSTLRRKLTVQGVPLASRICGTDAFAGRMLVTDT